MRVFLCHSSEDKPAIRQLRDQLRSIGGVEPWLDEDQIKPGQDWAFEIQKAVRTSHVVVVCLSRTSVTKEGFIQKEIRQALDVAEEKPEGTIFIIPLRLEECDVPHKLRHWQWVDWFAGDGPTKLRDALLNRAKNLGMKIGQLPSRVRYWTPQIEAIEIEIRSGKVDRIMTGYALNNLEKVAHETQSEALLRKVRELKGLLNSIDSDA